MEEVIKFPYSGEIPSFSYPGTIFPSNVNLVSAGNLSFITSQNLLWPQSWGVKNSALKKTPVVKKRKKKRKKGD